MSQQTIMFLLLGHNKNLLVASQRRKEVSRKHHCTGYTYFFVNRNSGKSSPPIVSWKGCSSQIIHHFFNVITNNNVSAFMSQEESSGCFAEKKRSFQDANAMNHKPTDANAVIRPGNLTKRFLLWHKGIKHSWPFQSTNGNGKFTRMPINKNLGVPRNGNHDAERVNNLLVASQERSFLDASFLLGGTPTWQKCLAVL